MCQVNPIGQRIPMPASCESVFGVDRKAFLIRFAARQEHNFTIDD